MWGRRKKAEPDKPEAPNALKEAVREARIEAAERSAVVVDLRDAGFWGHHLLPSCIGRPQSP